MQSPDIPVSDDVRDPIDRAASIQGETSTEFLREASASAAQRVLPAQVSFQLSDVQMNAFQAVVDKPVATDEAILRLLSNQSPWER